MFSYRHAFHAGNHADVLKHMVLVATLKYLGQKDTALTVVDTHAGAGLYRLDQDQAQTSGEALGGVLKLRAALAGTDPATLPEALRDYLEMVARFNDGGAFKHYPGSPWIAHALLRPQDKLKLFEVHPTDGRLLARNVEGLGAGKLVEVLRKNSFESLKSLLPPPSRRGLVLMDPSYELKTDYDEVVATVVDALKRFPTGTYAIWYPVIARPEAHAMAKKLKTLSTQHQRAWVQAELAVGHTPDGTPVKTGARPATQMRASGMHIINPPFTLAAQLREALPLVLSHLKGKVGAGWTVEHGG